MFDHCHANWIDDAEIELCWQQHRQQILVDWMQRPQNAGQRPWAFWVFDKSMKMPSTSHWEHPNQVEVLIQLGQLQEWKIEQLNEWNKPLINNETNIEASAPATGKGDTNEAEQNISETV